MTKAEAQIEAPKKDQNQIFMLLTGSGFTNLRALSNTEHGHLDSTGAIKFHPWQTFSLFLYQRPTLETKYFSPSKHHLQQKMAYFSAFPVFAPQ